MNKNFVIYDAAGVILRTGSAPEEAFDLQAGADEFILEGLADCTKDAVDPVTKSILEDAFVAPLVPVVPSPASGVQSIPVEQQLDLLWQAMDSGTFPKAEPFYSAIKAQKDPQ